MATTVALSALLLSACGGSSDDETPPVSTPHPAPTPTYNVTATAGDGGTISPGSATVTEGNTTSFNVTADQGFDIANVSGCGGSLEGSTYTTGAISEDCSVSANFEQQMFSVTATATDGGEVSPTNQSIGYGEQAVVSYSATTGYELNSIQGCDGEVTGDGTFTTSAITESCSVAASFSLLSFTISATASEGGSVSPASQNVHYNEQAVFEIDADEGFEFESATGCPGTLNDAVFTTESITDSCTLHVEFTEQTFELSASITDGGTITPTEQTVIWGQEANFSITLDDGFAIDAIEGCDGTLDTNSAPELSYTIETVTAACHLAVTTTLDLVAPVLTDVDKGDTQFTLAWHDVAYAQHYNLYLATEQGVTPDNFNVLEGGDIYTEISAPFTVEELDNETTYFFVVTAVAYDFESQPSVEQFVTPQAPFFANGGLNDVGVMFCADDGFENLDCPVAGYEGQAGDTGRDAKARDGELEKQGGGYAGFDFTKLNQYGAVLQEQGRNWQYGGSEAEGTRWSCVRDNTTGLYWHIATDDEEHPLTRPLAATWYNPDPEVNGGDPGREGATSNAPNSLELVTLANELELCGFNDWRVSAFNELFGLVNLSGTSPAIDMHYFPDTPTGTNAIHHTANTSANNVANTRSINFNNGNTGQRGKHFIQYFKLVRGEEEYVNED